MWYASFVRTDMPRHICVKYICCRHVSPSFLCERSFENSATQAYIHLSICYTAQGNSDVDGMV